MGFWEMRLELVLCLQGANVFCNLLSTTCLCPSPSYSSYLSIKSFIVGCLCKQLAHQICQNNIPRHNNQVRRGGFFWELSLKASGVCLGFLAFAHIWVIKYGSEMTSGKNKVCLYLFLLRSTRDSYS